MGGNMMNDAGKVLLKPKGRYDSLTTYEILDCVTYNGNAYVAKKTTVGNLPTEDGEYWCILIENVEITPTFTIAQNLEELKSGEQYQITFGKIAKAVKDYILHKVVKATNTQLGHVKVTNSAAVTDSTGLALAATEKNASIEGTLANLISQQNSNLAVTNARITPKIVSSFAEIPSTSLDDHNFYFFIARYTGADADAPDTSNRPWWWTVFVFGPPARQTQIAFCPYTNTNNIYFRQFHDERKYGWYKISGTQV